MLKEKLKELVSACFTGIWIESFEHQEAIREIVGLCREEGWINANWDVGSGLKIQGGEPVADATDPLAAIRALSGLASPEGTTLLVMNNLHKFVSSVEIMQALQHQLIEGKQNRTIVIGLSPKASIPIELEKLFVVWNMSYQHATNWKRSLVRLPPKTTSFPKNLNFKLSSTPLPD